MRSRILISPFQETDIFRGEVPAGQLEKLSMMKQIVFWTSAPQEPFLGIPTIPISREIDLNYRGTLISRILTMEAKVPISLDEAILIMQEHEEKARVAGQLGCESGQMIWFSFNFIEFISSQGYHIELNGDEFEIFGAAEVRC
jgi:hypothetical protein